MKIEISCRFSGKVIFSHEAQDNTMRLTVEAAIVSGAYLAGANLDGAYLAGANLDGAYLAGAYLDGAYLAGANLTRANLDGAYLDGANLAGANLAGAYLAGAYLDGAYLAGANLDSAYLAGANLDGANLARAYLARAYLAGAYLDGAYLAGAYLDGAKLGDGETLSGERPIFQIGPIGSRCACFVAYLTDKGLRFDAGCQRQITRERFEERLADEHGDNKHAKEYSAALALIDAHAEIWTPKSKSGNKES